MLHGQVLYSLPSHICCSILQSRSNKHAKPPMTSASHIGASTSDESSRACLMYASKAFKSSALWACRFLANCAFQLAASLFSEVFNGVVSSESEPAGHQRQQRIHVCWSDNVELHSQQPWLMNCTGWPQWTDAAGM
jgi:hypothetical protein